MATGGGPVALDDHAAQTAQLSLDMLEALEHFNRVGGHSLQVRIGVATGAVVAGVIGKRMYVYDVWGDAVNIACRMESHGVAGRVQVAESTWRLLDESLLGGERGNHENERKGELKDLVQSSWAESLLRWRNSAVAKNVDAAVQVQPNPPLLRTVFERRLIDIRTSRSDTLERQRLKCSELRS